MSAPSFSVSVQKAVISISINSTVLSALLLGIYTVVYIGALYVYLSKKSSQHWIVLAAISSSYAAYVTYSVIVWFFDQKIFVNDSATRETLFIAAATGPNWIVLVNDILIFLMAALADGILIWRCFNIWDRSLRVIIIPSFLLLCEIAADLALIILQCVRHFQFTVEQGAVFNHLLAAQGFITFGTSLIATFLIAYRVYLASKLDVSKKSKRFFNQVLEILVQSTAVYSLSAFAFALAAVIPQTFSNAVAWTSAETYTTVIFVFTAGVAPTIMVARVAFLDEREKDPSTVSMHMSGLQFHVRTSTQGGQQATGNTSSITSVGPEFHSAAEGFEEKEGTITPV